MTDFEQLGWLSDHATMEIGTMEKLEDEVINMLVWASGENNMKEESEEVHYKGLILSSSSSPKLDLKLLPSTLKLRGAKRGVHTGGVDMNGVDTDGVDTMGVDMGKWEPGNIFGTGRGREICTGRWGPNPVSAPTS
ncbi:hypothetical protein LWI28_028587 [Acer negundo]|uniref:Uncharacterized protein n=1 Tax=Acer negundo TaxID=4023 RepID=A0AAD5ITF7_ACENE|nr:hypothetical protein LWI28_028587 [Acer negundo]